ESNISQCVQEQTKRKPDPWAGRLPSLKGEEYENCKHRKHRIKNWIRHIVSLRQQILRRHDYRPHQKSVRQAKPEQPHSQGYENPLSSEARTEGPQKLNDTHCNGNVSR